MSNYIKTLILSTIVLVMGSNSNYCYSMGENNNGNIVENEHFLQDGNYLKNQFEDYKTAFKNQLKSLVTNRGYSERDIRSITDTSDEFFKIWEQLCDIFATLRNKIDKQHILELEYQFNIDDINQMNYDIHNFKFIPNNILNQNNGITLGQLSNYLANKIYLLIINSMKKILNIIDKWQNNNEQGQQDPNKLKRQIMEKIASCYDNVQESINLFLNYCNKPNTQNVVNLVRMSIRHYINYLMLLNRNLNHYRVNDDFLNKNYSDEARDILLNLEKTLNNHYDARDMMNIDIPNPNNENKNISVNIINEFVKRCTTITAAIQNIIETTNDFLVSTQELLPINVNDLAGIPGLFRYCNTNHMQTITFEQLMNYCGNSIVKLQNGIANIIQHSVAKVPYILLSNTKFYISMYINNIKQIIDPLLIFLSNNHAIRDSFIRAGSIKVIDFHVNHIRNGRERLEDLQRQLNAQ